MNFLNSASSGAPLALPKSLESTDKKEEHEGLSRIETIYALEKNGLKLQLCSDKIKSDPTLVECAIKQNPIAIQFASITLKNKIVFIDKLLDSPALTEEKRLILKSELTTASRIFYFKILLQQEAPLRKLYFKYV